MHTDITCRRSWAFTIAGWVIAASVFTAPLCIGATPTWAWLTLDALVVLGSLCWLYSTRWSLRHLLLPLLIAIVPVLQIVPLSERALGLVAPISLGGWKLAAAGSASTYHTISVSPSETAGQSLQLFLMLVVVSASSALATIRKQRLQLSYVVALTGLVGWLTGLLFPVPQSHRVLLGFYDISGPLEYWKTPTRPIYQTAGWGYLDNVQIGEYVLRIDGSLAGDGFGSFIYSNHFAAMLCLTVPFIAAAWISLTSQSPSVVRSFGTTAILAASIATAALLVRSRAGTLALLLACSLFSHVIAEKKATKWVAFAIAATCCAGGLAWLLILLTPKDFTLSLVPFSLHDVFTDLLEDPRSTGAQVATRAFIASPLLGTGLGTFDDTYSHFAPTDYILYYSHNDFLQLLAETGLVGLAAALTCIALFAIRVRRHILAPSPNNNLITKAAVCSISGLILHCLFDWNLHLPSHGFLACVIIGIAISDIDPKAQMNGDSEGVSPTAYSATGIAFAATLTACLAILCRHALTESSVRELKYAITSTRIPADEESHYRIPAERYLTILTDAAERCQEIHGSAELHVVLSQAYAAAAETLPLRNDVREAYLRSSQQHASQASRLNAYCRGLPKRVAEPVLALPD
jgi:hypothetical protein